MEKFSPSSFRSCINGYSLSRFRKPSAKLVNMEFEMGVAGIRKV